MSENNLQKAKNVYFIGIGGIGISAIARMLLASGKRVSGSDSSDSEITKALEKLGAKIFIGQKAENLSDCVIQAGIPIDLFIYTVAIKEDNPEFIEAKKRACPNAEGGRGVKMMTYAQTLTEISSSKYTIAVSGTHGKTTVTAMIAKILIDNNLDPTVIIGSLIKDKNGEKTNFIAGKSKPVRLDGISHPGGYLVVEACEYERSFLNIEPKIAVINNIDADHLDYYGDLNGVISGFNEFAQKVPAEGFIVCDPDDEKVAKALIGTKSNIIDRQKYYSDSIKLMVPGDHNRLNAATAIAVADILGLSPSTSIEALKEFSGAWRRFEFKGKMESGTIVYEDYAHNPQKICAALQGAREMFPRLVDGQAGKRIVVVFQPHLFSRTKLLLNDFATAFTDADEVILAPIFPAREKFDPTISSEILAEEIRKHGRDSSLHLTKTNRYESYPARSFPDFASIITYLKSTLGPDDVLITMGAGEQYKIGEALL